MHDIVKIKDEVVRRGFPELTDVVIDAYFYRQIEEYASVRRFKRNMYGLYVDTTMQNASRNAVMGVVAHELAHAAHDAQKNSLVYSIDSFLCEILPPYKTFAERRADMMAVERGFGQQLLEFVRHAEQAREKFTKLDGLTKEEIIALIEKMKTSRLN